MDFSKIKGKIYLNKKFLDGAKAKIHVLNHSLHFASSVFEGIRVYNKKVFKLMEHTERLFLSAKILDLDIDYTTNEIMEYTKQIVDKQKVVNGYIRPVVWRGSEKMAISAKTGKTNIAIATWPWPSYFSPEQILKGIKMSISDWRRPPPNCAPINSKAAGLYMICSLSKHKAESNGFDDALMLDYRDYIAEATGANIFFVKDNTLFTPKADCFLNGITRKTVIQIAKNIGITVKEEFLELNFLSKCEEAFLTGTAVEITPVSSIGDHVFKNRDITKKLIDAFKEYVDQN